MINENHNRSRNQIEVSDRMTENNNARLLAVRILTRVEKEGAYANLLLRSQLPALDQTRDRNLVTALVNGVLKNKLLLDYALRKHLSKPMSALPHEVRADLRIGIFQVLFMDKIPVSAAINESVEIARTVSKESFVPLVNSVLRKAADTAWDFQWPDPKRDTIRYLSVRYSHPEWMVKRWLSRWGRQETEDLLIANNEPAPTAIRVNTLKTTKEELIVALREKDITVLEDTIIPECLVITDYGGLEQLTEFRDGLFTVQDQSSQLVAHVLGVRENDTVLDVCSAPGGKTTHMAQLMRNKGSITAVDYYQQKLNLVGELAERLGITIIKTLEGDARELPESLGQFDRVLVDVPCSGLGVIRRRADLRWQKKEEEIKRLPELQLAILLKAAEHVRPGGDLVYSTCTLEPEENYEVVKAFRQLRPEFTSVDLIEELPFFIEGDKDSKQLHKGVWQILPHIHHMDGFFLAKFRRRCL